MSALGERLAPGDLVIDGGNSNYLDSIRHGEQLAEIGIGFVDCGTSGGVWGLENGYALMVGGTDESVAIAQPLFDALSPPKGFAHAGPVGYVRERAVAAAAIERRTRRRARCR